MNLMRWWRPGRPGCGKIRQRGHFRAVHGVSSSMVVLAHFDITRWVSTSGISRSACSNATPSGAPVAPVIPIISFIQTSFILFVHELYI
jgi:hypothetical protein